MPPTRPPRNRNVSPVSAGPCAAKGYPITIQFGAFVRPDGKPLPTFSGHALEGK